MYCIFACMKRFCGFQRQKLKEIWVAFFLEWWYNKKVLWACSSAGRAFGSHPKGREFESLQVHHITACNGKQTVWGISAAGSARHWQCRGQGFKSPMLHHTKSGRSMCPDFLYCAGR